MKSKMSGPKNLLEVDESILEKNLTFVQNNDPFCDALDSLLSTRPKPEVPKSQLATLIPGFCIKTRYKSKNNSTKVFINVCYTEKLPRPKRITESELNAILQSDKPSDYRVPMTIGDCRPNQIYDIGINTEFYQQCESSVVFKNFLLMLVFESIEDKFNVQLDRDMCNILQNRKCMGKPQQHSIVQRPIDYEQNIQTKSVSVATTPTTSNKRLIEEISATAIDEKKRAPPFRLYFRETNREYLICELYVNDAKTQNDIQLEIGEDRMVFESLQHFLDIYLPVNLTTDQSSAIFDPETKKNILRYLSSFQSCYVPGWLGGVAGELRYLNSPCFSCTYVKYMTYDTTKFRQMVFSGLVHSLIASNVCMKCARVPHFGHKTELLAYNQK